MTYCASRRPIVQTGLIVQSRLYIDSPEWQEKRAQAFRRYGRTCQRCKSLPATQVHHKTYKHLGSEPLKDLEVLCEGCHQNIHEPKYGNAANIDKRFEALVKSF
jgi:5-methylcytosine-specific restriction endonuclease McrA